MYFVERLMDLAFQRYWLAGWLAGWLVCLSGLCLSVCLSIHVFDKSNLRMYMEANKNLQKF